MKRSDANGGNGNSVHYGRKSLYGIRKQHIEEVLKLSHGDALTAAKTLGISVAELRRWMKKLEI